MRIPKRVWETTKQNVNIGYLKVVCVAPFFPLLYIVLPNLSVMKMYCLHNLKKKKAMLKTSQSLSPDSLCTKQPFETDQFPKST